MYDYLKKDKIYEQDTFYEHISKKKIGIWGVGSGLEKIKPWLKYLNINNIIFFDNDMKKQNVSILSPSYIKDNINENWFIIISSSYYTEIKEKLEEYGLIEYDDFIDGLDIENSIYSYKYRYNTVPSLSMEDICKIEDEMKQLDFNIVDISLDMEKVKYFEKKFGFAEIYDKANNKRYFRKILEYYIVFKLFNLEDSSTQKVYVDVGACSSPWGKILRENLNVNAYAIDLDKDKQFSNLDYYIIQDATATDFNKNSIDFMSLQSAYEMFMGNNDIKFIKECSRVLKPGGKVIILPLYMNLEYLSTSSPKYYKKGYNDLGSKEYIRIDSTEIRLARIYNANYLKRRVLDTIIESEMKYKIYSLPNNQVEKDGFIYLKFILEIEKM